MPPTRILSLLIALILLPAAPHFATAQAAGEGKAIAAEKAGRDRSAILDTLFEELKLAESEAEGRSVEGEIWNIWAESGERRIDEMMAQAREFFQRGLPQAAIDELGRAIEARPDFVDAYNRRATVLFFEGRFKESLADIARILELEPRHFGALSGRALIEMRLEHWQKALDTLNRAIAIHPYLKERHFIPQLEEKLNLRRL